jgi:hypothetical protein
VPLLFVLDYIWVSAVFDIPLADLLNAAPKEVKAKKPRRPVAVSRIRMIIHRCYPQFAEKTA